MKVPTRARSSAAFVLVGAAVAGCAFAPAGHSAAAPANAGPRASKAALNSPQASAAPAAVAREPEAKRDRPPDGLLSSAGETVSGQLGSYCYGRTCADLGQWPAKSELPLLTVTTGKVRFALQRDEPFVGWTAAYNDNANDDRAIPLEQGGEAFDPDSTSSPPPQFQEALIEAPPAGDWVMWVWIDLEQGDLSYAWHVIVMPDTATE
jgi:hypothetical protein